MNTTPGRFFANPAFREYLFLLVELERLFREGRGQSPEADTIREEMDAPGDRLDGEERKAVSEFAAELTPISERYASILLPTEKPARSSPDAAGGNLPRVARPEPRTRELT